MDITDWVAKYNESLETIAKLEAEITKLRRVIAKELIENDGLGSEYVYVMALKEEIEDRDDVIASLRSKLDDALGVEG